MNKPKLKIMVLAGGPDREHDVSLMSAATVTPALSEAGHEVRQRDIRPDKLEALDEFKAWGGEVVFPMLHGAWGEGGGLQIILEERGLPFVGCRSAAAALCMDKYRTKEALAAQGLPTPPYELLPSGVKGTIEPPLVVKATREGSSIDLVICRDSKDVQQARARLSERHAKLLMEKFVTGKELTVGVLLAGAKPSPLGELLKGEQALPPIHIIPAVEFYDYEAKYTREDTKYLFDIDLPKAVLMEVKRLAVEAARVLDCRHYCRVDMIVDQQGQPWIIEVNTIPGCTSHSLLPKAAMQAGITLPGLFDHLARMAME